MRPIRLTVSRRIGLVVLLNTVLIGAPVAVMSTLVLEHEARTAAHAAIERNMRVAWNTLKARGDTIHEEGGHLFAGTTPLEEANDLVDEIVAQVGGTATVFRGDQRVATTIRSADGGRALGTTLARNAAFEAVFTREKPFRGIVDILGVSYITGYDPLIDQSGRVVGILYVGLPVAEYFAASHRVRFLTLVILGVSGAAGLGLALLVSRQTLTNPLRRIIDTMTQVAAGARSLPVPDTDRPDDIGAMARALAVFQANAAETERLRAEAERLDQEGRGQRRRELLALADQVEQRLRDAVTRGGASLARLNQAAQALARAAAEADQESATLASASEKASANVESVSAAGQQLAASIQEIARQVTQSTTLAQEAVSEARETSQTAQGLTETAGRIGAVLGLINAIASQTNLLALNATIEASRAGEAGKGFQVVAHEVKDLAGQTAKATDEIKDQIEAVQGETHAMVAAIDAIGHTIDRLASFSTAIAGAVEEQGAVTADIARNVDAASQGVRAVSGGVSTLAQTASETGRMAESLFAVAAELADENKILERELNRFLAELRAGS
ncbi:methyl-accepting chemotaxis protein [Pararhodospirillum oryzae]|uniref:Methyl-accepting chemotaxis protein n=1 Tax=Pararhodospirillum oryzae TaxID=478448 RepID=A0A512HAP6_9PROT|nr:cache domain-containing protein [Pararhodospirillum oryzae]GEO82527.1 methyl-accepting chemotaxis protein [Pararhodospirillum oryzae]